MERERIILANGHLDEGFGKVLARFGKLLCVGEIKERSISRELIERIIAEHRGLDVLLLGEGWSPLAQMALPHLRRGGWLFIAPSEEELPIPLVAALAGRGIGVCRFIALPGSEALAALLAPQVALSPAMLGY
ncbi:MAG: hypothetical protein ACM3YO_02135 [Bacteroidota bacterium]